MVPRIDIAPDTHVHFVDSDHPPGGVGEPGVPSPAPGIHNAIFAADEPIGALPVDPQRLKV